MTTKAPKKKIEGAVLIGIDVAKEDDFSGCFVLKVQFSARGTCG